MRHGDKTVKLGRDRDHRRAMLNNLATSVLKQGLQESPIKRQVRTTLAKAKAVAPLVERLITYGKKGDLSAKRQAIRFVKDREAFKGLFTSLSERYKSRLGGYTRVLKLSNFRHGDNAPMAIISLVEEEIAPKKSLKKGAKAASKAGGQVGTAKAAGNVKSVGKPKAATKAKKIEAVDVESTPVEQTPSSDTSSKE